MDLWQLRIFRNVIEHKSFSKAAEAVHLTQPTISSHIKDLENHFGCRLIDRMGKKALPTKAGELLDEYAGRLLALQEETEMALAEFHGKISGRLIVGGSTIPGGYILPGLIGQFIRQYPEVKISLNVGDTVKTINDILSGAVELGIVGARTGDKRIAQEKTITDDLRLIIPATHKWAKRNSVGMNDLLTEPFIIREKGSGTLASLDNSLKEKGKHISELNVVAELGSTEAVVQGIKGLIGVSILSPIAVSDELNAGTLKALTVKGIDLKRSFFLTWHKDRSLSPLGRAFMEFLRASKPDG
jgi:DNA-binding transcriptional LysR family regulator